MPASRWDTATIGREQGSSLARMFSARVLRELAKNGYSSLAAQILRETGAENLLGRSVSLGEYFDSLSLILFDTYRNEYAYKNAIANKILLGRHSLNTAFMLTEQRVGDCIADVVILNGSSCVYEIKSEYDNKARLRRQLDAYMQVFDHVNVITCSSQQVKIAEEIPKEVGVLVLTDRNTIHAVRAPSSGKHAVDPRVIFDTLRQSEYVEIIKEHFGSVPDVPNTQIYQACKSLFAQLTPQDAHAAMVDVLKRRGDCESLRHFIEAVPRSLKALSLSCDLPWYERSQFVELLETDARQVLICS